MLEAEESDVVWIEGHISPYLSDSALESSDMEMEMAGPEGRYWVVSPSEFLYR